MTRCRFPTRSLVGALSVVLASGCGAPHGDDGQELGSASFQLSAWAKGHFSHVLRVNPGESTIRNVCELTLPLSSPKPLWVRTTSANLNWTGSAVAFGTLSVSECSSYPCNVVARWVRTSTNGSVQHCEMSLDDGVSRLVGTSSGTALTVAGAPTSPVIFNQDVRLHANGMTSESCVLRQSAFLPDASVIEFGVFLNGTAVLNVPGIAIGDVPWPTNDPAVSFGALLRGADDESAVTRLKHNAPRKGLAQSDAVHCAGRFWSQLGVQVFDVNVTNPPSGDGISLWTVSYDEVIGVATEAVVQGSQDARLQEVATGNLVADALRTHYGTDLAFVNGGGVGSSLPGGYAPADTTLRRPQNGYAAGPPYDLVVGDAYTLVPFSNVVVTRTVTGAQLWAMLENGFSVLPVAHGRFPQISGFRVVYDVELPAGARVVSVTLDGGTPIVADATTYTIALPDFLNKGGDFYSMLNDGTGTLRDLMPAVVAEYIANAGTITPTTDGRITEQ